MTDSQGRWTSAFEDELSRHVSDAPVFASRQIGPVTGYSYPDEGDATFDVTVRYLEMGPGVLL